MLHKPQHLVVLFIINSSASMGCRKSVNPSSIAKYNSNIITNHLCAVIAVVVYHLGCYAEYKLGIEDTAKVVPVHGVW